MTNTSATGGYLAPTTPVPNRASLEDALHDLIAGISGICNELVRPRWQAEPPREPKATVAWIAFGVTAWEGHNFPEVRHCGGKGAVAPREAEQGGLCLPQRIGIEEGCDEVVDHETLTVLLSFYGPGHVDMARQFRRGVHVGQNRAAIRPYGLALIRAGSITPVPVQVAMQWRARADLPLTFALETRERYGVLNILQTQGRVRAETSGVPIGCASCRKTCWR